MAKKKGHRPRPYMAYARVYALAFTLLFIFAIFTQARAVGLDVARFIERYPLTAAGFLLCLLHLEVRYLLRESGPWFPKKKRASDALQCLLVLLTATALCTLNLPLLILLVASYVGEVRPQKRVRDAWRALQGTHKKKLCALAVLNASAAVLFWFLVIQLGGSI